MTSPNPANVLALIEAYEALTAENSQLRQWYAEGLASIMSERDEATASRDALLALLSEAGETLRPFAEAAKVCEIPVSFDGALPGDEWRFAPGLTVGDMRRARALSVRIAAKLKENEAG